MVLRAIPYRYASRYFFPVVGLILFTVGCVNLWRSYKIQNTLEIQLEKLRHAQETLHTYKPSVISEIKSGEGKRPEPAGTGKKDLEKKESESDFEGYIEAKEGTVIPPGAKIKMDLKNKRTFYKLGDAVPEEGQIVSVPGEQTTLDSRKDKIDMEKIQKLRSSVKPQSKAEEKQRRIMPRINALMAKMKKDNPQLLQDLGALDAETLSIDASIDIWKSTHLDNLFYLFEHQDEKIRAEVATILYNSLHNLPESAKLAIHHLPRLCALMKKENDSLILFKLISCIHAVFFLHRDESLPIIIKENVWSKMASCQRPLSYEKTAEIMVAAYEGIDAPKADFEQILATVLGNMPKQTASQIISPLCTLKPANSKLQTFCRS